MGNKRESDRRFIDADMAELTGLEDDPSPWAIIRDGEEFPRELHEPVSYQVESAASR